MCHRYGVTCIGMRARVLKLQMQALRLAASSRSATQGQDRFAYLWKPIIHVRASWLVEQLARVRVLEVVCDVVVDHDDDVVIRNAALVQHLVCLPQSDMRVLLDLLIIIGHVEFAGTQGKCMLPHTPPQSAHIARGTMTRACTACMSDLSNHSHGPRLPGGGSFRSQRSPQ